MKKNFFYPALIVLTGLILGNGCSKSYNTPMPMPAASSMSSGSGSMSSASVTISNMAFMPDTIKIKMGTTVTWTNMGMVSNTVTEVNDMFNSGNLTMNQSFSFTFSMDGTFKYNSLTNPMMEDAVVIVGK